MAKEKDMRQAVLEKYGQIARTSDVSGCCSENSCNSDIHLVGDAYHRLEGYVQEADLGLGCGLPTQFAKIYPGSVVVDLGSGAGNDVFVARQETGPLGKVIGIDFTPDMINRARHNLSRLGYENVEFILGEIEKIPLADQSADIVISNCVFNLVTDKKSAFEETFRILRPGGHFSISDIVTSGKFPEELRREAALYTGCITGALARQDYIDLVQEAGFVNLKIQKETRITIPEALLDKHLNDTLRQQYQQMNVGVFSATFYAEKPDR